MAEREGENMGALGGGCKLHAQGQTDIMLNEGQQLTVANIFKIFSRPVWSPCQQEPTSGALLCAGSHSSCYECCHLLRYSAVSEERVTSIFRVEISQARNQSAAGG
jgi:hypothetical protein